MIDKQGFGTPPGNRGADEGTFMAQQLFGKVTLVAIPAGRKGGAGSNAG